MVLSPAERDALVGRVERRLVRARVTRATIADAVDRVLGALESQTKDSSDEMVIVAVSAESTPDLASRLRRTLTSAGVPSGELASATEGRHTVVTIEVATSATAAVEQAVASIGAHMVSTGARG